MVGLGQTCPTSPITSPQRHGDRRAAARAGGRAGSRAARAGSSMVVYGEGALPLPPPRRSAPAPRDPRASSTRGLFEPRCPRCELELDPSRSLSTSPSIPGTSTPRPRCTRSTVPRVLPRDRGSGHRAALPQRLRTADAARHAVRRGRRDLRQRAGRRAGAARVRGRRQRRDFVHVRDVAARQRARADERSAAARRVQHRQRHPRSVGEMATALAALDGSRCPRRSSPASFGLAMCVTCSPRRIGPNGCSASGQAKTSTPGCRSSRPPRCESPEGPLARGRRERAGH